MHTENPVRIKAYLISLFAIPVLFYMEYWLIDGAVWCADSVSYVVMYDSREPLYPLILALLRKIVGIRESLPVEEQPYLFWVAGLQSILAGVSVGSLVTYLVKRFKVGIRTGYALIAIPILVSLLNRYAARRGSMYSNCILTEGITISIYMLFIRFLFEYICTGRRGAFVWSLALAVLGISARKQMYVLAGLLILTIMVKLICVIRENAQRGKPADLVEGLLDSPDIVKTTGKNDMDTRGLFVHLVIAVAVIAIIPTLFDCTYNYFLRGSFIRHTEDNRFVSTMVFYTADREFSEYVTPELRDIYLQIYDACDEAGYTYRYEPDGWMGAVDHFAQNYDHIQLDTMEVILEETADDTGYAPVDRCATHSARMDAIRREFNSAILPHETGRIFRVFVYNFLSGLVLTVARMHPVLCVYSALLYAGYAALMVLAFFRWKKTGDRTSADSALFGVLVMVSTLLNTALVSAVIFCQTRYTIYNFPLVYMAFVCMAVKVSCRRTDQKDSEVWAQMNG